MGDEGWRRMVALAGRQHGLLTSEQFREGGVRPAAVRWRLDTGQLERVCTKIYRFPAARRTWEQRAQLALLRLGPGSTLSHASAAHVLRLDGFEARPATIEALMLRGRGAKSSTTEPVLDGLVLHRTRVPFETRVVDGLRVTDLARTILDLAGQVGEERLEFALDAAQRRNPRLGAALEHTLERGHHGVAGVVQLSGLLDERDGQHTDSALEAKVFRLLRKAGVRRPVHQHDVFDRDSYVVRLDFAWVREKVALHVDGYGFHSQRERFEHDREVTTRLTALGWNSIRVTSRGLDRGTWVEALRAALRAGNPQLTFFKT